MEFHHVSVLLNETIDSLNIRPDGVYVDGTLGGGGHSLEIVKRLSEKGRLIGLDRDENAIQAASERLKGYKDKITFVRSNYDRFPEIMQELGLARVDGIVLDLGVSSYQLDTPERGFSYREDAPGGGGHSLEIVKRLSEKGRLIGLDRDENAIQAASERLKGYKDKITFVRSNYDRFPEIMQELGLARVDGIVLDLGVSSYQLDTPERGFSYREDAPLDMRMDQRQERTAADIVNGSSEKELINIFRNYGEERFAPQIARRIVRQREEKPVRTTFELNEIIKESIPVKFRLTGGHPSKRTFQAIRIALNAELESLEKVLPEMIEYLNDRGRLSVITFHSLEDRIVKNIFKTAHDPCTCPPDFPICVCGNRPKGRVVTGKPVLPSEEEIEVNKRSKSAKLRVFERRTEEK